jgi:hypothetical protein
MWLRVWLVVVLAVLGAAAPAQALTARGSTEQAYVLDAPPGATLRLVDARGRTVAAGRADRFGSRIFRRVRPGRGYRIRRAGDPASPAFTVLRRDENPPAAFYRGKRLKQGLNYVEMRDGVELAMTVRLPPGKTLADGPFPTVIEYSGYQIAAPNDLLASVTAALSGRPAAPDPLAPSTATAVGSVILPLLDFAVVSVQMRGSGCSGGAFDLFDLPTTYDGYDASSPSPRSRGSRAGRSGWPASRSPASPSSSPPGTRPPTSRRSRPMSVTTTRTARRATRRHLELPSFARSWITDSDARRAAPPAGGQPYARASRGANRHLPPTTRSCACRPRARWAPAADHAVPRPVRCSSTLRRAPG